MASPKTREAPANSIGGGVVTTRVANAPAMTLEDATERARKYWDKLEGRSL
jgi:hypothetical protein